MIVVTDVIILLVSPDIEPPASATPVSIEVAIVGMDSTATAIE